MTDADISHFAAAPTPFQQLMRITNVLGLLSRHQGDARVQTLIDNLWLDRQRIRSRLTPGGVADTAQLPMGDRWDNEIPALYAAHLASRPVWPPDEMCQLLERNVAMFAEEFAAIDPNNYQVDARDHIAGLTDGSNWTVFPFYDGFGNLQADNARQCPRIADFLAGLPGAGSIGCMAFFSIMNPDTHVPAHTSEQNLRMRYHLGVEIPHGDMVFRIHGQSVTWQQDRCIKIDDSYEHEVFQRSDRRRVVFVLDLPHADLSVEERGFLQEFMRHTTTGGPSGSV